jgi:hypothetical protein
MPFKKPHSLYGVWQGMKQRCLNKNNPHYKNYGGRGITVCDRWINDFHIFVSDIGKRPKGFTLDRINNDKGYSPDNCRWATRSEQQLNRRDAVWVTIEGEKYRPSILAKIAGTKQDTIINRANNGYPYNKVISKEYFRDLSGLALGGQASGAKNRAKTHCAKGHRFLPENTRYTKEGWRVCKKCKNIRAKERHKRLCNTISVPRK